MTQTTSYFVMLTSMYFTAQSSRKKNNCYFFHFQNPLLTHFLKSVTIILTMLSPVWERTTKIYARSHRRGRGGRWFSDSTPAVLATRAVSAELTRLCSEFEKLTVTGVKWIGILKTHIFRSFFSTFDYFFMCMWTDLWTFGLRFGLGKCFVCRVSGYCNY